MSTPIAEAEEPTPTVADMQQRIEQVTTLLHDEELRLDLAKLKAGDILLALEITHLRRLGFVKTWPCDTRTQQAPLASRHTITDEGMAFLREKP